MNVLFISWGANKRTLLLKYHNAYPNIETGNFKIETLSKLRCTLPLGISHRNRRTRMRGRSRDA